MIDLATIRSVHIIGIGGAGMSAITHLLLDRGLRVAGSDLNDSAGVRALRERGATVHLGHHAANVGPVDLVVHSSAVPPDNPELAAARERGLPTLKRPELLTLLSQEKRTIAVAGTHGKTTTTAMTALALHRAGLAPSHIVGGDVPGLDHAGGQGSGEWLVIEADEYDRTFLALRPEIAVLTNAEPDHLDFFGTAEAVADAFARFVALVPPTGTLIVCAEADVLAGTPALALARQHARCPLVTYAVDAEADWVATNLRVNANGGFDFDAAHAGRPVGPVSLRLPGRHNVLNGLAALAAAERAGADLDRVRAALGEFAGARRRFDRRGTVAGIEFVDDYAHHPTELRATLAAARALNPTRLICLLQPHTLDRTRRFAAGFADALKLADRAVVLDPFRAAGREATDRDTSAARIAALAGPTVLYLPELDRAVNYLARELRDGDLLIVAGAGDVVAATPRLMALVGRGEPHPQPLSRGERGASAGATAETPGTAGQRVNRQPAETSPLPSGEGLGVRLNLPADLLRPDEPLARRTTAKVGGVADWLFEAKSKETLKEAVLAARVANLPWLVLGAGSNVLIADRGVRGLVIANLAGRHRLVEHAGYAVLAAESGAMMPKLARLTARAGYGGFEWGTGVPGTVGGSVAGNAGAYGGAVADNLIDCEVLTPAGETIILPADELRFAYRFSTIKYDPAWVVLSARFRLEPAPAETLAAKMAASVHQRKTQQPAFPSSGSVFKNPPGDFAGRLVEAAGLKGLSNGGAQVSTTHANFIVNRGGATATDMFTLIEQVRERVRERFGVALELEIRLLGDW